MMKRLRLGILFSIAIVASAFTSNPPCGSDAFMEQCAPSLGNYFFLKTFDVNPKEVGEKIEVKYIMSKGANYRIAICDEGDEKNPIKVKMLDRNHKVIATNSLNGKYYPSIDFKCTATGVYYIESSFKPNKTGCGALILGFQKN